MRTCNNPTPGVMKLATASAACSYIRMRLCGRLTCMPDCPAQMQIVSVTVLVTAIFSCIAIAWLFTASVAVSGAC